MNGGCIHHSERVQSANRILHPIEQRRAMVVRPNRRRWIMNKIALVAATAFIATTASASAASIDAREHYQAKRIEQGRKTGKITWTEGLKLRAEQNRIKAREASFRSDGYLSPSERRKLSRMQDNASDHIKAEKHDGWKRAWWLPRVGK
jgi:hypothetical protein